MEIKIPGVDAKTGLGFCDDDMEIYTSVLRSYASTIPGTLEKMQNVTAETLKNYAICVHGVKSSSLSIGADETGQAAKKLELLAKAGDLQAVLAQNEAFIKQAKALAANIQSWLEKNNTGL